MSASLLVGLAAACAQHAPAPSALSPRPAADAPAPVRPPCEEAEKLRARVANLQEAGKLDRVLRVIEKADALCPSTASETAVAKRETSATLARGSGKGEDVRALVATGRAAERAGHHAEAQRAFDRALAGLEAQQRVPASADGVTWMKTHGRAAFSADGSLVALVGADGRHPPRGSDDHDVVAVVDTRSWETVARFPRAHRESGPPVFGGDFMALGRDTFLLAHQGGDVATVDLARGSSRTARIAPGPPAPAALFYCPSAENTVFGSALSAAADSVAVVHADGALRLHRASSGALYRTIAGKPGLASFVGEDPDGARGPSPCVTPSMRALAFSPDGALLAAAMADESIRIFRNPGGDVATVVPGRPQVPGHAQVVDLLTFAPRGGTLAAAGDGKVQLIDVRSGARGRVLSGLTSTIHAVAFRGDDGAVAAADFDAIVAWDASSGRELARLPLDGVEALAFRDGGLLVVTHDSVKTWDFKSGVIADAPMARARAWLAPLCDVRVSEEAGALAVVEARGAPNDCYHAPTALRVVQAGRPRTLRIPDVARGTFTIAPDGQTLAVRDATAIRLVALDTWLARAPVSAQARVMAFDPAGRALAWAGSDRLVHLWDVRAGVARGEFRGHAAAPSAIAWSRDGALIAAGATDKTVRVWDATKRDARGSFTLATARGVAGVVFSGDGQQLFAYGEDMADAGWDLATRAVVPHDAPTAPMFDRRLVGFVGARSDSSGFVDGKAEFTHCREPVAESSLTLRACGSGDLEATPSLGSRCRACASTEGGTLSVRDVGSPGLYASIELVADADAAYVRALSPRVVVGKRAYGDPFRARLTSGEIVTVPFDAFDGYGPIDSYGEDARLECRVGVFVLPFAVCRERFFVPGLVAKVIAGDRTYREP